ncbi:MAG: DUF423 domain-containing protein [Deltaproteobacteria bacterium CG_4_10_14_0_2_um_filter_43_8]|nr:MAG: hypothetical protein COV43_02585 [Deltaproteobacteria bacterium CG11_big_fil_rev_8_21_14_0_20_42_23]PJA21351.1 MAG: DUF423 domain-containing protein [Deltaproteobacteria bacterium CG_4_10_14_0_2_um_filter_43_8]PJC64811.1 MAG: DUF423 domain-containing protein [Deltaproteobacteria bacterium CG_4_9_14_0_2_um_filter_42_21]
MNLKAFNGKHASLLCGITFAFLAVLLGAFGAHLLQHKLTIAQLEWWETANLYQMWHSLALILFALWAKEQKGKAPLYFFSFGILLFSGSLYVMALTGITSLGMITPFGGFSFLLGWLSWARLAIHHPL